jgi:hypothetical protein
MSFNTPATEARHKNKHLSRYNHTDSLRDYYPPKPQYPSSPIHKTVKGVLGSVLGYEITKYSTAAAEASSTDDPAGQHKIQHR